jgi:hypothetical protein
MAGAIYNTRSTLLHAKVGRVSKMPPNITTYAFWSKTFRVSTLSDTLNENRIVKPGLEKN